MVAGCWGTKKMLAANPGMARALGDGASAARLIRGDRGPWSTVPRDPFDPLLSYGSLR